jgi:hypothetical protein
MILDRGLGALALLLGLAAALRWHSAASMTVTTVPVVSRAPRESVRIDPDSLDEFVQTTHENDPFRLSNSPATVPFNARGDIAAPAANAQPRPQLVVTGIVGGPPWQAILDGLPGQPAGTIVRAGGTFDKLTVRSITRDTVVVQAPDTTWRLTLSRGRP